MEIFWNRYSKFWAIFQHIHLRNLNIRHSVRPTFVSLCRRNLPPWIGTSLSQNTVHITFHAHIVFLNFVFQGDPLWLLLGFWGNVCNPRFITCDDMVQKLVAVIMIPLQRCQCWLHTLCFVFWCQLLWNQLAHNFRNNSSPWKFCATRSGKAMGNDCWVP